jgi:hypothetical protein
MTILEGAAIVEMIRTKLKTFFRENIDWEITMIVKEQEFLIVFLDDDKRYQLERARSFEFHTAPIRAQVRPTELNPGADGCLEVVWVRAYNFPDYALYPEVAMEVAHLVGDPEEVDMASLKGHGAVRIKIGCRDSREVKGETQVYFNGDSHRIKWVVETGKDQFDKATNALKFDRHSDKADEEEEEEEPHDKHRPQQKQNKRDMGHTSDINRGGNFQQKANILQITLQTLTEGEQKGEKVNTSRGEEATITSRDNQVMTQQSVTDGEKVVIEKKNMEMGSLQGEILMF